MSQPHHIEDLPLEEQQLVRTSAPTSNRFRRNVRPRDHRTVHPGLPRPFARNGPRSGRSSRCSPRSSRGSGSALARVDGMGPVGVPAVLFLCVHNAGRSQMAAGWLRHLAGDNVDVWSGGTEPDSQINPAVIEAMTEVGIDIRGEFPKPWTEEIVRAADVVITMGCGDACPSAPASATKTRELDDPASKDLEAVRPIRDDIRRVEILITSLNIPSPSRSSTPPRHPPWARCP